MHHTPHHIDPDSIVAATLAPTTLARFAPELRRLLAGSQMFVRQPDGRYRPRGCSLGFAQCFEASDLIIHEH